MATAIKLQNPKTVLGKVTDANGRPLSNLKVVIYDVDMREWQPLADTLTNKEGKYELRWTHDQSKGKERKTADIGVKVFTKVKGTELYKSSMDGIRFNASDREEINITIRQALPKEIVEFDYLSKEVSFLAGKVAIVDLQENDEHHDITFLSKELEVPAEKIEHLIVAYRLHDLSKVDTTFFYAILRKNTLLHNNFAKNLNARLSIGIGVEDETLLYDAALADHKKILVDIKTAVEEKIVSTATIKNAKRNLEILSKYRKKAEEYYKNEHREKAFNLLTNFFKEGKLKEIQKLFVENKNNLNSFFDKVSDPDFYDSKGKEKEAKTTIVLGKLFGFGSEVIPNIMKAKGIKKPEDVRKLAKLNKAEWIKEITKARPDIKDKQLIGTYASAIVRKMEKEFPTLAFAAQLERSEDNVIKNKDKMVAFFNKHEDFDFLKHNVNLFLKEKRVSKKDKEAITEELKSIQRVFKLVPKYSKTMALREEKIHSSQSIVAMGEYRFVKEVAPKAGIEEKEAKKIYRKAETKHTAAMLVVGDLQDSMSVKDIASFETTSLTKKLEAVSKDFPNLKSLFKLVDTCECEHCRSVYSPAAYLVELLQFLDKRSIANAIGTPKGVLFSRRPELGEIDLGCANANTPVKYIDLVCEILEEAIAPNFGIDYSGVLSDGADPLKGKISNALHTALTAANLKPTPKATIYETESSITKPRYLRDKNLVCKIENTGGSNYKIYHLRQTFGTAAELDAAPEYVNEKAYQELKIKKYAFKLPFDLHHTEAKAYLNRFDVTRADLMKTFQKSPGTPLSVSIAKERLGLTEAEKDIVVATPVPNDNAAQQSFWNVPMPGDVVDYLKTVDHFLDRTSLKYKELDLLLKLKFIDKNDNLFIKHHNLTCDTAEKEIAGLDLGDLDRINRFLRLQMKTGWRYQVLDAIISQGNLGNGTLDDSCIVRAGQIKEISEKLKIKVDELIGFFGEIPHAIIYEDEHDEPKPLYHQIFLNKAKNGVINEGLLPEKVDGSQLLNAFTGYIATCLQLKQKDLEFITPLLPDGNLTFSNLSFLLASSRLIKNLKLKAEDFAIIQKFSGIDISASPDKTLEFIEVVEEFKNSPLKATDVKFILNHEASNLSDREVKVEKIEDILKQLKEGYKKINEEQRSKFNDKLSTDEQKETLIGVISGLQGKIKDDGSINLITEGDVKTIIKFLAKDWTDVIDVAGAKTFIDDKFDKGISRTNINAAIDALEAVASNADSSNEQKALIKAFLDAIADNQITTSKQTLLNQTLSTSFKVDLALAGIVVKYAKLKQPAPGTDLICDLLSDNFDNLITPGNYAKQYAAIKLLHKIFVLQNTFKLSNTDAEWYFKNNADPALSWFEFDSIPYETGQTAIDFAKYVAFCSMVAYSKQLTAVSNPLDAEQPIGFFTIAELILQGAGANRAEFLLKLALLTGYEKEGLDAIDAYLFAAFDIANYKMPKNWKRLFDCAEFARKLGATLSQITKYINPILTKTEVDDLRATLKSRYDEDTWLSTQKEIMDAIRPQKRNALVAYLLATNPDIKDENDLYEYFLVDVEMESCMPSSRIVLAHNSIQLFVQRCLMGLEPNAIADVEKDPNWNQWKWMKNYRVWEANRKVFLYPENWYDVTLTDDKTFLLTEFINEIQQNELTNDTAEEALKKYLEKLDNIAFLEVMATWYDVPARKMHVFARTKGGDPAIYYYRRFESERYWSPWEKVELDITGNHLLAFVRNNRLHLAWPIFSEEAKPDQQSKIPSKQEQEDGHANTEQPEKKLKIQLAISEYTNKKWQPKKVSSESVSTPKDYYEQYPYYSLRREQFNLRYLKYTDQIWLFSSGFKDNDYHYKRGVFDITGCKGYPELVFEGFEPFTDFLPDFKQAELKSQRYNEINYLQPDDLSVRNGISPFYYYEILDKTPGKFRISYPHQFTGIDLIALIFQFFQLIINAGKTKDRRNRFKIPFGTLLPYFKEDSYHAYVIIPGFYKKVMDSGEFVETFTLNDSEKRTASNAFQFLDDITNWFKKISFEFKANPPVDVQTAIRVILIDTGFQNILKELSKYADLDVFLNLLVGLSGDPKVDEFLKALIEEEPLKYGEQFKNMYHPLVCALRSILYKDGIPALMKRETQLQKTNFNFKSHFNPNSQIVPQTFIKNPDGTKTLSYPVEDIDFESDGSYSTYNWDLFFRVPLHIAGNLTKNQRFEEALTWFHYMFNPTGALSGNGVQKYWVTKPFYLNQETDYIIQRIDTLMYAVSDPSHPNVPTGASSDPAIRDLEFAISEWRNKPFRPDVIMRFRPVAYQKALLMKYIDNLTEWGDYLFRQDTMESIAQATQMYILADKLLGPKPRIVPAAVKQPYETYNQIEAKLDSFGNALIELENILPDLSVLPEGGDELPPTPVTLSTLYFCIPSNNKMFEYWDRVADRLFKIRHCQNIDGVERSLALFAPPIDPGMLVRATASGLDLSSVIAGLNAPTPYYRFNVLSQKATELAQEVRGLGNSLLQALEKKDAEAMSLLRSELELKVLNAVKDIKELQIDESKEQIEVLKRTKKVTEERQKYYREIEFMNALEITSLTMNGISAVAFTIGSIMEMTAGATALIPTVTAGGSGFGGSPVATSTIVDGDKISNSVSSFAKAILLGSQVLDRIAGGISTVANYQRRYDDWKLQERLANKELASIEKQIAAAEIRKEIAETDLNNHELQIENAKKTDDFLHSKFTNKELYDWMIGQISSVYFKSYQLAHDFAKKSERCYQFELGNDDSFISYGYWDSLKKGLQSADALIHDIKRMETGYLDKNKREYEITKHVSLAQLDPLALIRLRATGICDFEIPEVLYDMDHPGQYFRRIKSVSVSLPCIAGSYTSVSAKLSLVNNRYRKNINPDNVAGTGYTEDPGNDERFVYNVGAIQSIATSNSQNDSGIFELNFRDERYLPFENTGAISSWRLELPTEVHQFDYNTISDVIIHVKYMAREGGSGLKNLSNTVLKEQLQAIGQDLNQSGLHVALNLKHDLPNEWQLLKKNNTIGLTIDKSRLPYMAQSFNVEIEHVTFIAKVKNNPTPFSFKIDGNTLNLAWVDELGLCKGISSAIDLNTSFTITIANANNLLLEDLLMIVKYKF
ncbi:neuraminidase-like domain-containing protein [Mariniflexile sp. HMF6888]|uniref:Tc toxin subunit A-related protein n=1 Tax=Mariniflexile sp. HMF6888 TaxID=3373086 RepID=UPI003797B0C2